MKVIFTFADGAIVYKLRAPVTGIIEARFYSYLLLIHTLDSIPPDAVSVLPLSTQKSFWGLDLTFANGRGRQS